VDPSRWPRAKKGGEEKAGKEKEGRGRVNRHSCCQSWGKKREVPSFFPKFEKGGLERKKKRTSGHQWRARNGRTSGKEGQRSRLGEEIRKKRGKKKKGDGRKKKKKKPPLIRRKKRGGTVMCPFSAKEGLGKRGGSELFLRWRNLGGGETSAQF